MDNLQSIRIISINEQKKFKIVNKKMQKGKIDLENLLAKYENGATGFTQSNLNESKRQMQIEQSFYGKRTLPQPQTSSFPTTMYNPTPSPNHQYQQPTTTTQQHLFVGTFKMSKQQCQSFLLQIQQQLNKQKKTLSYQAEIAYKQITQRFNRNHEKIRKEILELLDGAFRENERLMKQELVRQARVEAVEFEGVKANIQTIEQQIAGYLRQLRSADYRKAISQVVLKDYTFQIKKLKDSIEQAKTLYIDNLGQIQPDVTRIQCLKSDLKRLFYFKKKTAKVVEKSIYSILAPTNNNNNQQQQGQTQFLGYNESKYEQPIQAQSRTRKSFFNFGQ